MLICFIFLFFGIGKDKNKLQVGKITTKTKDSGKKIKNAVTKEAVSSEQGLEIAVL